MLLRAAEPFLDLAIERSPAYLFVQCEVLTTPFPKPLHIRSSSELIVRTHGVELGLALV